jgi:hypothetical protein
MMSHGLDWREHGLGLREYGLGLREYGLGLGNQGLDLAHIGKGLNLVETRNCVERNHGLELFAPGTWSRRVLIMACTPASRLLRLGSGIASHRDSMVLIAG